LPAKVQDVTDLVADLLVPGPGRVWPAELSRTDPRERADDARRRPMPGGDEPSPSNLLKASGRDLKGPPAHEQARLGEGLDVPGEKRLEGPGMDEVVPG